MAYKRRYNPRKRNYRKKQWYNKKYSAKDLALKALKKTTYLSGLVNSEKKVFEYNQVPTAVPNLPNGYRLPFTAIGQGDTMVDRNGNSIFARYLNIKGTIYADNANTAASSVRVWLIKDTQQTSDATPPFLEVFANPNINTMLNRDTLGRFTIMYTKQFNFSPGGSKIQNFNINKVFRHHVRYNGPASTDIQKGGIYLFALSDSAANQPLLSFFGRLRFYDN